MTPWHYSSSEMHPTGLACWSSHRLKSWSLGHVLNKSVQLLDEWRGLLRDTPAICLSRSRIGLVPFKEISANRETTYVCVCSVTIQSQGVYVLVSVKDVRCSSLCFNLRQLKLVSTTSVSWSLTGDLHSKTFLNDSCSAWWLFVIVCH